MIGKKIKKKMIGIKDAIYQIQIIPLRPRPPNTVTKQVPDQNQEGYRPAPVASFQGLMKTGHVTWSVPRLKPPVVSAIVLHSGQNVTPSTSLRENHGVLYVTYRRAS